MPRKKRYILKITPQTHVRATQGDKILFRIPEDKLHPAGLKRKLRLLQYNDYRYNLFEASRAAKMFQFPESGAHIIFYMPVPKSWTKKKKRANHLVPCKSKPDLDNLLKAFKDALLREDKTIWDYRITKYWIDEPVGYIEVSMASEIKVTEVMIRNSQPQADLLDEILSDIPENDPVDQEEAEA